MKYVYFFLLTLCLLTFGYSQTSVPPYPGIRLQGSLTDNGGNLVSGLHNITIRIYKTPTTGLPVYTEVYNNLSISTGILDVIVGATGLPFDSLYYVETQLDNEVFAPRTQLASVPYAIHAFKADTAMYAKGALQLSGGVMTGPISSSGNPPITMGKGNFGSGNTNAGTGAFVAGTNNQAQDEGNTIGGGANNTTGSVLMNGSGGYATVAGGGSNSALGNGTVVSGGTGNVVANSSVSTIGGGSGNNIYSKYASATVKSGGENNSVGSPDCAIGGGSSNFIVGVVAGYSTIGGGSQNNISAGSISGKLFATTSGGGNNAILTNGEGSVICGGENDTINGVFSTIPGGIMNAVVGDYSTISGGTANITRDTAASIGGGSSNTVAAPYSTIGGGSHNGISSAGGSHAIYATIGGGMNNSSIEYGTTVGGGTGNIAGGYNNQGYNATVGGGGNNSAVSAFSTVGGGSGNSVVASGSTISGGGGNTIPVNGQNSVIGGGNSNTIGSQWCFIGGGGNNFIVTATAPYSVIGGGNYNAVNGDHSFVGGGAYNNVGGGTTFSTISGGDSNNITANYATILGGLSNNASGDYSLASGQRAKALHTGAFVWADNSNANFSSTTNNQFNVRSSGGTRIFSNAGLTAGVTLAAGASAWASVSDSTMKRNARIVDGEEILRKLENLPIKQWSYKAQDPSIEHVGPMAQDFYNIFKLGDDNKTISTIDPSGVALAAIKALHNENQELKRRLNELEAIVRSMANAQQSAMKKLADEAK